VRILFFMFTGERTGSETALHNYIHHVAGKGWEMAVACESAGELIERMPPGVPTFTFGHGTLGLKRRTIETVRRTLSRTSDILSVEYIHKKFRPGAWYVNTCIQPQLVRQAKQNGIPCIMHTHELEQMLGSVSDQEAALMVSYPALIIAGSQAACDVFRMMGRDTDIEVCYENIDRRNIHWNEERSREIRRELKIGTDTFVWAMSGTLDPNKNPVRFVEIAAQMLRAGLDVHFIWLGGGDSGYSHYARQRAKASGVDDKVTWLGARGGEDYYNHLNAADGLVLTSFHESFSLVSVEAAYLGKPVVSFDCGGVREIVKPNMGVIVQSWNNSDLISSMARVMRAETGFDPAAAQARVAEFDIEVQGPRWESLVTGYLARAGVEGPRK
jgi:glycosyltransferase involved in cell wall biosynthesis